jgi:hypothetical protein
MGEIRLPPSPPRKENLQAFSNSADSAWDSSKKENGKVPKGKQDVQQAAISTFIFRATTRSGLWKK